MKKAVSVRVAGNMTLEQCQKVLAQVLGKAGHPNCYSGFKISFDDIVDPASLHLQVDKTLNVHEIGL